MSDLVYDSPMSTGTENTGGSDGRGDEGGKLSIWPSLAENGSLGDASEREGGRGREMSGSGARMSHSQSIPIPIAIAIASIPPNNARKDRPPPLPVALLSRHPVATGAVSANGVVRMSGVSWPSRGKVHPSCDPASAGQGGEGGPGLTVREDRGCPLDCAITCAGTLSIASEQREQSLARVPWRGSKGAGKNTDNHPLDPPNHKHHDLAASSLSTAATTLSSTHLALPQSALYDRLGRPPSHPTHLRVHSLPLEIPSLLPLHGQTDDLNPSRPVLSSKLLFLSGL